MKQIASCLLLQLRGRLKPVSTELNTNGMLAYNLSILLEPKYCASALHSRYRYECLEVPVARIVNRTVSQAFCCVAEGQKVQQCMRVSRLVTAVC